MSDRGEMNENDYKFLEYMSTEKLKSIILADFMSGDTNDETNDELITHALEVISKRFENDPAVPNFDVESGWKKFQSQLNNNEKIVAAEEIKHFEEPKSYVVKPPKSKKIGYRIGRIALISAIVACTCVIVASALEINLFKMIAEWTQDIFQFQSVESSRYGIESIPETQLKEDQTLNEELAGRGYSAEVTPQWFPEGFYFSGLKVYDDLAEPMLTELYENNSNNDVIIITVNIHQEPKASIHEKDTTNVEVFEVNGIDHYIMKNNDQITAVWFVGELECSITGEVSQDDLKTMIKSIYGSE